MAIVKYKSAPVSTASPVDRLASEIFGPNISRLFGSDGLMDHGPRVNIVESNDAFRLEMQAPGFDKNDWPDFADPDWSRKIDEHYRKTEVRTGADEAPPRVND